MFTNTQTRLDVDGCAPTVYTDLTFWCGNIPYFIPLARYVFELSCSNTHIDFVLTDLDKRKNFCQFTSNRGRKQEWR